MNKKTVSLIAVYAIVFVVYALLFFVIPFPKNGTAWVEFAFTLISIAGGFGITYYSFSKGEGLKSKIYGFPIFRVGAIYSIVQICFGIFICVIGFFISVPIWISAAVSIILLAFAAIGVIAADNVRDIIEQQERNDTIKTKAMTYFRLDIQGIVDMCGDAGLKKRLTNLNDTFKYSDPVSSDELSDIESQINNEIEKLQSSVNGDQSTAESIVSEIERLIADRNRRCKALKQA